MLTREKKEGTDYYELHLKKLATQNISYFSSLHMIAEWTTVLFCNSIELIEVLLSVKPLASEIFKSFVMHKVLATVLTTSTCVLYV